MKVFINVYVINGNRFKKDEDICIKKENMETSAIIVKGDDTYESLENDTNLGKFYSLFVMKILINYTTFYINKTRGVLPY